jgi:GntR family transcriptional regulator, transcriptional repressor for pyruvate dehydrogenase complex
MTFDAIEKSSTPGRVAEQILRRIETGLLAAGERLPAQRDLAEQLGVGRSSLREAINALAVMGHLEVRHGSGTYVRREQPADQGGAHHLAAALEAVSLLELMEAREMLECKSAVLAAERADTTQIRQLKAVLDRAAETPADYSRFLKADIQFHTRLAEAAGNAVIQEMTRLVLERLARQHGRLRTDRLSDQYRRQSIDSAREVVTAVERGDGTAAGRWMEAHLQLIRSELKGIL